VIYDDAGAKKMLMALFDEHWHDPSLQQRAARLWPDSPALQAEWLRAVEVVRSTSKGWLLDRRINRA
jgi:hypothetical protein